MSHLCVVRDNSATHWCLDGNVDKSGTSLMFLLFHFDPTLECAESKKLERDKGIIYFDKYERLPWHEASESHGVFKRRFRKNV